MSLDVLISPFIGKSRPPPPPRTINGKITFTLKHISKMLCDNSNKENESYLKSNEVQIEDVLWHIRLGKNVLSDGTAGMSFFVACRIPQHSQWFCFADLEFRLVPHDKDELRTISWRQKHLFGQMKGSTVHPYAGYSEFENLDDICDPSYGFVNDDSIYVEVIVSDMRSFGVIEKTEGTVSRGGYGSAMASLHNNKQMSDMAFVIGKQKIFAHKLLLSLHWPDMYDWLFIRNPNLKQFPIPDGDVEALLSFLLLFYRKAIIISEDNMRAIYKLAIHFGLKEIVHICLTLIVPDNVVTWCQFALDDDSYTLYSHCIKIMANNMDKMIEGEKWLNTPRRILKSISVEDELNISEIALYEAVVRWGNHNRQLKNESLKECIGELMYNIRFPSMSLDEFSRGPDKSGLLEAEDVIDLYRFITARIMPSVKKFDFNPRRCVTA